MKNGIKILVDGLIYDSSPHGGIASLFREILPRIADRNQNIIFYIYCREDSVGFLPRHKQIIPLYFYELKGRPFKLFSLLNAWRRYRFNKIFKRLNFDIFHSTFYTLPPFSGVKTVATVHDLIDYQYSLMMPNGPLFLQRQANVLSKADRVISVSKTTTSLVKDAFNIGSEKISTIYLDAGQHYRPQPVNVISQFKVKYTKGKPFYLFVGETGLYKNLTTLIRAFGFIKDRNSHLLLLAGCSKEQLAQEHIDLAIEHQVEERILRLIHPPDEILSEAYNAADAFVFPSLQEGFGMPLVEAMRCGTPVVASDIPVFHEICGDAALYFDPHDSKSLGEKMTSVLDPSLRECKIKKGRSRAELYSWDKAALQTEKIYFDLVNTTRPGI